MPWNRHDPDPLEARRRQLAEQQRLLAEQMSRLTEELQEAGEPIPDEIKPQEPPVWRLEDDTHRLAEFTPARKRNLARQRQRDLIVLCASVAALVFAVGLFFWLRDYYSAPNSG